MICTFRPLTKGGCKGGPQKWKNYTEMCKKIPANRIKFYQNRETTVTNYSCIAEVAISKMHFDRNMTSCFPVR